MSAGAKSEWACLEEETITPRIKLVLREACGMSAVEAACGPKVRGNVAIVAIDRERHYKLQRFRFAIRKFVLYHKGARGVRKFHFGSLRCSLIEPLLRVSQ